MGMKSCIGVYLLELVRLLIQYKWGTNYRQEWFSRMEEMTKRNGKGILTREIEKVLKRFDASLEWLMERIAIRDEEMDRNRHDGEIQERAKKEKLKAMKMRSIDEVLEEVRVLIDTTFMTSSQRQNPHCF